MIYGKLPIVFLTTIASDKRGSTNSTIASYILEHLDDLQKKGIKDIANECHVAISSVSRFCKEIGLRDFVELKDLISSTELFYENDKLFDNNPKNHLDLYYDQLIESATLVKNSIDMKQVQKLCKDIDSYKNVSCFGLLKAGGTAINMQCDLLMLGKSVYTNISYNEQIQYMLNASSDDLIIIFSYAGGYFDYHDFREFSKNLHHPKIWFITGAKGEYAPFIDELITFESETTQVGLPYQLQFVQKIIANEYAIYKQKMINL